MGATAAVRSGFHPCGPYRRRVCIDRRAAGGCRPLCDDRPFAAGPVNDSRLEYQRRLDVWGVRIERLNQTHLHISNLRLLLFGISAVAAWLAFVRSALSPAWIVIPAVLFGALLIFHGKILHRPERVQRARLLYERGLARLGGHWAGSGSDGSR